MRDLYTCVCELELKAHDIQSVLQKVLVEAVESIKLMNPHRMTLRQNTTAGPVISQDETNSDIKYLDWFECSNCSVTSVQNHNIHTEALTSTDLALYEGNKEEDDDELIQSNCNSTGKRPVGL